MKKLPASFYRRKHVLKISKELMGKVLVTRRNGVITSGRIVELEAYHGVGDKASHAVGGRRTARNEVMYGEGGVAYVYLCYGIHHLFNVVTHTKENPHAILIRALEPLKGIPEMEKRIKREFNPAITRGPGNLTRALGITVMDSGISLQSKEIFIADDGFVFPKAAIHKSPRIGVEYAGPDALLPYRFYVKGNAFVSGKPR